MLSQHNVYVLIAALFSFICQHFHFFDLFFPCLIQGGTKDITIVPKFSEGYNSKLRLGLLSNKQKENFQSRGFCPGAQNWVLFFAPLIFNFGPGGIAHDPPISWFLLRGSCRRSFNYLYFRAESGQYLKMITV